MISYLQGVIAEKQPTRAVIDIQGVGYDVAIPVSSYERMGNVGEIVKLFTYLHVREDALLLFGFATQEEREMFLLLISVSGIGPKSGLGILSSISIPEFKQAILGENLDLITSVPGVGKKTAQRLVIELKEKVAKMGSSGGVSVVGKVAATSEVADEAMMALISLGYNKQVAEKAIAKALRENPDKPYTLHDLIKAALRFASGG